MRCIMKTVPICFSECICERLRYGKRELYYWKHILAVSVRFSDIHLDKTIRFQTTSEALCIMFYCSSTDYRNLFLRNNSAGISILFYSPTNMSYLQVLREFLCLSFYVRWLGIWTCIYQEDVISRPTVRDLGQSSYKYYLWRFLQGLLAKNPARSLSISFGRLTSQTNDKVRFLYALRIFCRVINIKVWIREADVIFRRISLEEL